MKLAKNFLNEEKDKINKCDNALKKLSPGLILNRLNKFKNILMMFQLRYLLKNRFSLFIFDKSYEFDLSIRRNYI